jgi:hypothetical protein
MLRTIGRYFWRFMIIFSFIVNFVLIVVLLVLGIWLIEIKNQIAQPLVAGLHSSFVGLDDATIDWTIPVRDTIPIMLDIPLETDTVVVLTDQVPLRVNALIDLPGINAYNVVATVNLELPVGLELPVALDLDVAVDQPMDIALDVRAVIPLEQTQLHDVAENLRLLFDPLAVGLTNLPNDFGGAADMVGDVLWGDSPDLLAENDYSRSPWPGYSLTAGLGYTLHTEPVPLENMAVDTGIVPLGGIPVLDEMIRPELYDEQGPDSPEAINDFAYTQLDARNIDPIYYNGGIGAMLVPNTFTAPTTTQQQPPPPTGGQDTPPDQEGDQGIIPTPSAP